MADLAAIRTALANTLQTALPGPPQLRVSSVSVGTVNPPEGVIMPQPSQGLRFDTFDGGVTFAMRIALMVGIADNTSSQALLDSYLSTTGPFSIAAALKANPRLGGAVEYCNMDGFRGYGMIDWGGVAYLGTQITLTILAV